MSATAPELKARLERESTAMLGVLLLNLGLRAGVWEALRGGRPATAGQLAAATGLSHRYLEELLRAAALHGYLQCHPAEDGARGEWDSGVPGAEREAFALTSGMEEVLFDPESPDYYGHDLLLPVHLTGPPYERLAEALRTDAGVPYSLYAGGKFGDYVEQAHQRIYTAGIPAWLAMPELAKVRLALEEGGVALDLGCGSASSSLALAQQFPGCRVHAVDCDAASIEKAVRNIAAAEERGEVRPGQVVPHCCFAHEATIERGSLDLVMVFIALHDMHNPSEVLASTLPLLKPSGTVLVLEFTAPDSFSALLEEGASPEQRGLSTFCYSVSVLHCLPVSKTGTPSQAVGTQFSLPTMQVVAEKAGFSTVKKLRANDAMTMFIINK